MKTFKFSVSVHLSTAMFATALLLSVSVHASAQGATTDAVCAVDDGVLHIVPENVFGIDEVKVLRPDRGTVYLFSPSLGVYDLTPSAPDAVKLDWRSQTGMQSADDGNLHRRRAFSETGRYVVMVLGDAIHASPPVQYISATCTLDFVEGQSLRLAGEFGTSEGLKMLDSCDDSAQPTVINVCRGTSGCGDIPCCRRSGGLDSPCFCAYCCVARGASTGQ